MMLFHLFCFIKDFTANLQGGLFCNPNKVSSFPLGLQVEKKGAINQILDTNIITFRSSSAGILSEGSKETHFSRTC
jgi:hypothetical protein